MPVELSLTHTESGQSVTLTFESTKALAAIEKATVDVFGVVDEGATVPEQATALLRLWTQETMQRVERYEMDVRRATLEDDIKSEFGFDEPAP